MVHMLAVGLKAHFTDPAVIERVAAGLASLVSSRESLEHALKEEVVDLLVALLRQHSGHVGVLEQARRRLQCTSRPTTQCSKPVNQLIKQSVNLAAAVAGPGRRALGEQAR